MRTKTCERCKVEKDASCFHKNKRCKDGLQGMCKECRKKAYRADYDANRKVDYPEKVCPVCNSVFKPKQKNSTVCGQKCSAIQSVEKNKDRIAERAKKFFKDNVKVDHPEKECPVCKKIFKPRQTRTLTCSRACSCRLYHIKNKEKEKLYAKEYREKNREKVNAYNRKHKRYKRDTDINFKITANLRKRLYNALNNFNGRKGKKTDSALKLLGCSLDEFKIYLQDLFQPGMSFDNYGEWHIDHILPCSLFDLRNSEEQEICFHYTNLQPLHAKDNLKKSNKLEF